jgi:putative hydrolase of the HAD superfamily
VRPLVDALRDFEPAELVLYPRARDALKSLAFAVPVALVTDGDPKIQRAKLRALRLGGIFDAVVISDEIGRLLRKPHPASLIHAARRLRVEPTSCVYIGDRPAKDVAAARAARMRAIRVRTGEYRWSPDVPVPWATARDLSSAVDRIRPLLANRSAALPERACR